MICAFELNNSSGHRVGPDPEEVPERPRGSGSHFGYVATSAGLGPTLEPNLGGLHYMAPPHSETTPLPRATLSMSRGPDNPGKTALLPPRPLRLVSP
jgi:hypothetical protein